MSLQQAFNVNKVNDARIIRSVVLNFGPQHPASHGVLRLVLQLNGEVLEKIDPHIGFLHRGSEKLMETRTYMQAAVYLDRLDYTSVLTQTHAYCICVESLLVKTAVSMATYAMRTIFDELARMLNHLLAISTHSLDVGSMAPLFWAFEDRERIMELVEYVSGARMHAALYLPNQEICQFFTEEFTTKLITFLRQCYKSYTEMFISLFNNRVWKARLVNIGVLDKNSAVLFGATGPILRGSGVSRDLRLLAGDQYAAYCALSFRTFVGINGDSYDRFLVRSRELFESIYIILQTVNMFCSDFDEFTMFTRFGGIMINDQPKSSMERLINKFKVASESLAINPGISYKAVEAGKGEFGVMVVSSGDAYPYRVFLRSPAFNHLQLLPLLGSGHYFADLITLVGTLDLVFGEVDR